MFYLGQRMLSKVHQMGKQREGNLQAGGQQGGLQTVGTSQEQAGHELRDHGQSSEVRLTTLNVLRCKSFYPDIIIQVLLPERNTGQGGRTETGVPVR